MELQVDLGKIVKITKVMTQGRSDVDQWVMSYWLSHSLNNGYYQAYGENSNPIVSIFKNLQIIHEHNPSNHLI